MNRFAAQKDIERLQQRTCRLHLPNGLGRKIWSRSAWARNLNKQLMENKYSKSKYRWYVLSLAAITLSFCMAMPHICMPVLFEEISTDLGLSLVQVGWIWGFFPMSGLFIVFIAGLLADRFG